jgi:hypothetical protein
MKVFCPCVDHCFKLIDWIVSSNSAKVKKFFRYFTVDLFCCHLPLIMMIRHLWDIDLSFANEICAEIEDSRRDYQYQGATLLDYAIYQDNLVFARALWNSGKSRCSGWVSQKSQRSLDVSKRNWNQSSCRRV